LVVWDFDFNLWVWTGWWDFSGFGIGDGSVVHDIVIVSFEPAVFVISGDTDGWVSNIGSDIVSEIHTEVFWNDVVGFDGGFVFLSSDIDVSDGLFVFPRIGNVEEEPIIGRNITDVKDFNLILRNFLNSEGIGR
jgi:hypothetical protein